MEILVKLKKKEEIEELFLNKLNWICFEKIFIVIFFLRGIGSV